MSSPPSISFSRAAPRYREYAHVQTALGAWLAEWAPVRRTGAALEIGAGTGLFTHRLLPWHGRYVATDLSPQMCAEGRRECPQVEWLTARAETPPDGPWDWIFSSSTLQWLDHPAAVFKQWKQMLGPGGRILAGFFVKGSLPELRSLTDDWAPLTWRSPDEWEEAVEAGGLKLLRSETREGVFWHRSALEMLRRLHGVGASPIRRYSGRELRDVLTRYDAEFGKGDRVRETWKFQRFEASW